jgi:hypothetical protein
MSDEYGFGRRLKSHLDQNLQLEDDITEYRKQWERDVLKNLDETVAKALKVEAYQNRDFYVEQRLPMDHMAKAPISVIVARLSCPTPIHKQSAWKYVHREMRLQYMWTIPAPFLYYKIINNAPSFLKDPETSEIAKFCVLFSSGELLAWVKKECGEKQDAIITVN